MAQYIMIFRKPKPVGPYGTAPICKHPVEITDLDDYKNIRSVFMSGLLSNGKYISEYDADSGDESTVISADANLDVKKKVCFTDNIKFSKHCLKNHEVQAANIDRDTRVIFIDKNTLLQTAINNAQDGDVIAILDSQIVSAPLTCDEDKTIIIDMCGNDIFCKFDGEIEVADNLEVRNSIPTSGSILKYTEPVDEDKSDTRFATRVDIILGENGASNILSDIIAGMESGQVVGVPSGTYPDNIIIDKAISIVGEINGDAIISGTIKITAAEGTIGFANLSFANATSTAPDGTINTGAFVGYAFEVVEQSAANVNIINCKMYNQKYFATGMKFNGTGVIHVDGLDVDDMECGGVLSFGKYVADGTLIENSSFAKDCCRYDTAITCINGFQENAVITFKNVHYDYSGNAVCVTPTKNNNASIIFDTVDYDDTCTDTIGDHYYEGNTTSNLYAGLLEIISTDNEQRLDGIKVQFSECTYAGKEFSASYVKVRPKTADEQLFYVWFGNDVTTHTYPTVYINHALHMYAPCPLDGAKNGSVILNDEDNALTNAILNVPNGATIDLDDNVIEEDIIIDKDITIKNGSIKGKITVDANYVTLDHITLEEVSSADGVDGTKAGSKGELIVVNGTTNLEIKNCKISQANNFYTIIKVNSTGKFSFVKNEVDANDSYHVIEWGLSTKVSDIVIQDNVFAKKCCNHNAISMYDYKENAAIMISGNFYGSDSCYRFSNASNEACNITFQNETLDSVSGADATDAYEKGLSTGRWYTGMALFQVINATTDLTKMNVEVIDCTCAGKKYTSAEPVTHEDQFYYVYYNRADYQKTLPNVTFK